MEEDTREVRNRNLQWIWGKRFVAEILALKLIELNRIVVNERFFIF